MLASYRVVPEPDGSTVFECLCGCGQKAVRVDGLVFTANREGVAGEALSLLEAEHLAALAEKAKS